MQRTLLLSRASSFEGLLIDAIPRLGYRIDNQGDNNE